MNDLRDHQERQAFMRQAGHRFRDAAQAAAEAMRQLVTAVKTTTCEDCERCTWNPGADCGRAEHPHCKHCGHCQGRHADQGHEPERFAPSGEVS